ncbi:hypothetical protein SDC9_116998 [bioreactor metagenome]|uniref:Uncharacterized protein n=1 Tax=bioreactor metagenome TaxID=1076179 RepID=A0A645BXY7_9ZZZZ
MICRDTNDFIFVIFRSKFAFIKDGNTLFELDRTYIAVFHQNAFGTPAVMQGDTFRGSFLNFFRQSWHFRGGFQTIKIDRVSIFADGRARHINGNVAAPNDNDLAAEMCVFTQIDSTQKIHPADHTFGGFPINIEFPARLRTDGQIKAHISLFSQGLERHILAYFHAGFKLHPKLAQDLDLGVDHVFLQAEGGNAKG